ncbi:MAG: glycosyltransferase, exosortase A system-associated [Sphingobium sp.]|nr:glycosyltransferase, exosortase A system-associated [Sphingobium sp.]MBP6111101.1 glycosyltransferase, exosortase A system-associated [Sphingobium sp.]MBP8670921.1 glycosyltransferase, exosortase A system-associated [Sphingobium sp.]MBP9157964.1 glycosyltransferase, exosortase A system-associated [Sphingobium sp.]MCC6482730.1 glycosyltransferase, exosortase A system-associated [Sphingomonadaceae bacterium]
MTRILHILDHSLPMHSGYSFRTRAILRAQIAQGWEVRGLTGQRHSAAGPAVETVDGLTFYRTPLARRGGPPLVRELREVSDLARAMEGVIRSWRPDIIHAHSPVLNALAAQKVARRNHIPMLYEIRAFWEDAAVSNGTAKAGGLQYRLTHWLETLAVRRADAVAVICEGLKNDLVARGVAPAKIIVSPNGVDMEMFGAPVPPDAALRAQLGLDDAEVIGFIGSFYDYEGLDDLIAAMPMLAAARPKAKLLLVGGGPMEANLRAQAEGSNVRDAIRFVGRVPHDTVEQYYALTDILAYPRKAQRLTELVTPLKPLEAMAQGRLVAASSVGGHRELIEDGVTGTLFAPDDPAAIARALEGLLADRAGWDARRATAKAFVEAKRNWAVNVSRYEPVYHILLERNT